MTDRLTPPGLLRVLAPRLAGKLEALQARAGVGLQRRPRALQETHHVNGLRQVLRLWWCKAGAGDKTPGSALLQRPPGGRLCRRHCSIEVLCRAQRSAECSAERSAAAAGALERGDAEAAAGGDLAGEAGRRHGGGEDRCLDLGGGAAGVVGGIERRRAADVGGSLVVVGREGGGRVV